MNMRIWEEHLNTNCNTAIYEIKNYLILFVTHIVLSNPLMDTEINSNIFSHNFDFASLLFGAIYCLNAV